MMTTKLTLNRRPNPDARSFSFFLQSVVDAHTVVGNLHYGIEETSAVRPHVAIRLRDVHCPSLRGLERPEGLLSRLFVVELFHAAAGQAVGLVDPRRMTNQRGQLLAWLWLRGTDADLSTLLRQGGWGKQYGEQYKTSAINPDER